MNHKKKITILLIGVVLIILGLCTIKVFADSNSVKEDEETLLRMVTSLSKGVSSNNEVNTNTLSSFFSKYLGNDKVNVEASSGDIINVQFNQTGNSYNLDMFKGMDFGQGDRYIVSYNANGGQMMPYIQTTKAGESIKITENKPTKQGDTFLGWSDNATDTVAKYVAGDLYTVNNNITLYAIWTESINQSYTITYNANGGTGAPNPQIATRGESITISTQVPTKEGFTFKGWAITSFLPMAQYKPGDVYKGNANITLYAIWGNASEQYTITFDANGGSGAPSSIVVNEGESTTIPTGAPSRDGYTFKGWGISSTTTTVTYTVGQNITPTSNMTLYAIWEQNAQETVTYTITFDANGGSGAPSSISVNEGESTTIPTGVPTRSGYTFKGWGISSTATTATYTVGQNITPTSNMTLYAVWEQDTQETVTITFNANGGTGGPSSITGNVGETVTIPTEVPTRTALGMITYKFKGWSTTKTSEYGNSTAEYQAGDTITLTDNMTLYAVWGYSSYGN